MHPSNLASEEQESEDGLRSHEFLCEQICLAAKLGTQLLFSSHKDEIELSKKYLSCANCTTGGKKEYYNIDNGSVFSEKESIYQ